MERAPSSQFTYIKQDGQMVHYRHKKSEDTTFSVAWEMAAFSYEQQMSTQVCLIERERNILWTEEFRRADSCDVSNDGTVAVKNLNPKPGINRKGQVTCVFLNSINVVPRDRRRLNLDFGEQEEVMSFALSPDGSFLIYNLQKYRPDIYQLVLYNLRETKEEWRYKYPQDQIVHELIFKGPRILAYSGPIPSAYVERRYGFTLDLRGRLVENDIIESQKQKESDDAVDSVIRIIASNFADIVPTVEVSERSQAGVKASSSAYSSIMMGQRLFPALYVTCMISPTLVQSQYHLNITVIARSPEERDKTVEKCLLTLTQKKEEFMKNGLVIVSTPQAINVPSYRGGGSYFRANVMAMAAYRSTSADPPAPL